MTPGRSVCLIGTGAIASDHMEAFEAAAVRDLRWVVSRRADSAAAFAEKWSFRWGLGRT